MNEVFNVSLNPTEWFGSSASLAAVVAALIALVRKHIWRKLDGTAVVAATAAVSLLLAYLGHVTKLLAGDWVIFGLTAAVLASGGKDLIDSIKGKNQLYSEEELHETSNPGGGDDPCSKLR